MWNVIMIISILFLDVSNYFIISNFNIILFLISSYFATIIEKNV